ncbi:MAG: polysaccharide export protein, partial [Candidatus Omnitrophica bacterium]|nr:polysaccharide export protein [Candidatus Omnitrophota bacterium]
MRRVIILIVLAAVFLTVPPAGYAEEAPLATAEYTDEYTVGTGDVLNVSVLQPEPLVLTVTVAPDGAISFPYIGSVMVKGNGLTEIQEEIQTRLADGYMKYPVVSVSLIESRSRRFFVYGEVMKPGAYFLEDDITVLRAISMAGGFTKFGSLSKVKVLRRKTDKAGYKSLTVNIKAVMNGDSDADLVIEPGDIIVSSEG